jgi:FAD/FMN-containing dehydrogenase
VQVQAKITSFGRLRQFDQEIRQADKSPLGPGKFLPRGLGRSYGDVCLNPGGTLLLTSGLNNLLDFDSSTGLLTLEAGITLGEIQKTFVPLGWMLSVTPGTQFVTVGGAIANDVHGKNHHSLGTFGDNTRWFELVRSDGQLFSCSATENSDMFFATIGGLGLTGLITRAQIQLQKVGGSFLDTQNIVFRDTNEFLALSDASEQDWQYSVSWVDCTSRQGRGIFMRGNNSSDASVPAHKDPKIGVPFTPPVSLINKVSVRTFNELYFAAGKVKAGESKSHYLPYFYPLDAVKDWNLAYGPKGFYQYQLVIPRDGGEKNLNAILRAIQESGQGSFLAVLKTFGNNSGPGMLSFARPGITLALDFVNQGQKTEHLFKALDRIVLSAGGTLNPSKDARMTRMMFESGFPKVAEFEKYRDPAFSSGMSQRLMGW